MTDNDNREKTQRTKYIDTTELPLPARGWQTRDGLAARARQTAVRQARAASAALTRYEERKLLRTELEHAAYDRYYMIVDLAAELELGYTPPRPGADEALNEYIEARDAFLEMLVQELTMRREKIVGQEIVTQVMNIQATIATYKNCGVRTETPPNEAPIAFDEIVRWHNAWQHAFELAKIEYRRIQQMRAEEWTTVHALMRELQMSGNAWRAPELREEFEAIVARDILTRYDLRTIESELSRLEYFYRGCCAQQARELKKKQDVIDTYRRALEVSRQRAITFREEHPPLITALRLIAEEEPYEHRFTKRNEHTGKEKIYSAYFHPRRFKRYEERLERLAFKVTGHHQGTFKIRNRRLSSGRSGHTGAQADPRRDWRREQRAFAND